MSELNSSIEFWVVGIMITVVSVAGILGNIICILMFQYKTLNMTQTFASLLKWLAVIDSLFLVSKSAGILLVIPPPPLPCRCSACWYSPSRSSPNITRYGYFLMCCRHCFPVLVLLLQVISSNQVFCLIMCCYCRESVLCYSSVIREIFQHF